MPLYFAYGSNMDVSSMQARCPRSQPLGRARLMRRRFILMPEGYASVVNDPRCAVHGVLWDLALSDVRALDSYENTGSGLYRKIIQPVFREGGASARALVYVGRTSGSNKSAPGNMAGYIENIIGAARYWEMPPAYIRELEAFRNGAGRSGPKSGAVTLRSLAAPVRGERDAAGNIKVRARFASPLDRDQQ